MKQTTILFALLILCLFSLTAGAGQYTERDRRDDEEVAGSDVGNMVGKKRAPRLRGRFPYADHVLAYRSFGNVVAQ